MIDRSPARRGGPAAHTRLAGDAADGDAPGSARPRPSSPATSPSSGPTSWSTRPAPARPTPAAVRQAYTTLRTEVIAGQYLDLHVSDQPAGDDVAGADPLRVALLKSGRYTVTRPLELGARLAGGGRAVLAPLLAYGDAAGIAFQLRDDVLGVFGDESATGKDAFGDLREGKRTLLVVRAMELATGPARRELDRLLGDPAARPRTARHAAGRSSPPAVRWRPSRRASPPRPPWPQQPRWRTSPNRRAGRSASCSTRSPTGRCVIGRMDVVVIGAGLAGLSAACHLRGAGHDVLVVEAGTEPGGRAGTLPPRRLPLRHRSDRADHAGARRAVLHRARHLDGRPRARCCPSTRCTGRRSPTAACVHVRHGREAMAAEIRGGLRPGGGGRLRPLRRLGDRSLRRRDAELHRPQLRLAARSAPSARPGAAAVARRGVRPARPGRAALLRRRAAGAPVQLPGDVRRARPAAGAGPVRRDHLHGRGARRDRARRRDARPAGRPRRGGRRRPVSPFAYGERVERIVLANGTSGPVRGVRLAGGEVVSADAVVCTADLPVAYRMLLPGTEAPRRARRGHYSPSAVVWHVGTAGELPPGTAHHNIHFGQRVGRLVPRRAARRAADARSVGPGHRADARRAVDGAARAARAVRARTGAEPRRPDRLGDRAATRAPPAAVDGRSVSATRSTSRSSTSSIRPTGRRPGWSGAPRSPSRTASSRPGPFRPANVERRAPGLVFAGSGTVPGVGVPMVLVSGELAAARVARRPVPPGVRPVAAHGREVRP